MTPATLYRWQKEFETYQGGSFPGNGQAKLTEEQQEIQALKKALAEAELERDILKEAVTIFS